MTEIYEQRIEIDVVAMCLSLLAILPQYTLMTLLWKGTKDQVILMSPFVHTVLYCSINSEGKGLTENVIFGNTDGGTGWVSRRLKA